jgi:8-oxo-dGTP pyrophosphatase MutT (NUDIX family)
MTIVERPAVRAILLTPQLEVLLMRIRLPGRNDAFWITPGGGLAPGETHEDCLRRELQEELGLEDYELGPVVWLRQHTFAIDGARYRQLERFHVVHVEKFEPHMSDELESRVLDRFRWWHASELFGAAEPLAPKSLAQIVARYLEHGAPKEPLELEVVIDDA